MKRYRTIRARRARTTIPHEAAYIAAGFRRSPFWQMVAGLADAEDKTADNRPAVATDGEE